MSRHISLNEYLAMIRRTDPPNPYDKQADEGPESELASKIRQWAENKGYPCLIHPQTQKLKRFIPPGYPDVVLSLPHGITVYIELKSKKGIWKDKQKLVAMQLTQLGHQYCKIKSFKAFLDIVAEEK